MPQVRKDEVLERIVNGALSVIAAKGYADATMGEIARAAGVSTGNLYRYFTSKEEMFEAALGEEFVTTFRALLRRRVHALAGVSDVATLGEDSAFAVAAEELLAFCISHRLRVVILLGRARGSRWEAVSDETVHELVELAVRHFRELRGAATSAELTAPQRFVLEKIYRNLVGTTVDVLAAHEDEAAIRDAIGAWTRYHLAGLRAFFAR